MHHTAPITYIMLEDYKGEAIDGSYYKSELQLVNPQSTSIVRVVKERNRKGKEELLVQFAGYPEQANTWLTKKEYFNFNQ